MGIKVKNIQIIDESNNNLATEGDIAVDIENVDMGNSNLKKILFNQTSLDDTAMGILLATGKILSNTTLQDDVKTLQTSIDNITSISSQDISKLFSLN